MSIGYLVADSAGTQLIISFNRNLMLNYKMVEVTVNGYRKIEKLGQGALGEAYLVEGVSTGNKYAMKVVANYDEDS